MFLCLSASFHIFSHSKNNTTTVGTITLTDFYIIIIKIFNIQQKKSYKHYIPCQISANKILENSFETLIVTTNII